MLDTKRPAGYGSMVLTLMATASYAAIALTTALIAITTSKSMALYRKTMMLTIFAANPSAYDHHTW